MISVWLIGRAWRYAANLLLVVGLLLPGRASASPPMSENVPPASVSALAAALKGNVDLIYQYVHDHVRYVPVYGCQRGSQGTMLDGEGSDCDQAQLMYGLLNQAGNQYSPQLISGYITLSSSQVSGWLGIDNQMATAQTLFANGGIPVTFNGSGSSYTVTIPHVWVSATIGGTSYVFDPSFKPSTFTSPINLASAFGSYNGTAYSASAIGGGGSVVSSTVRAQLQGYATNLESYIKTNYPNGAKLENIIGGQTITPLAMPLVPLRQTSLPYQSGGTSNANQATSVSISCYSSNIPLNYGVDNYILANFSSLYVNGNTCGSGLGSSPGQMTLTITYPYLNSTLTQTANVTIAAGYVYEVVVGYGHMGRAQIEQMRKASSVPSGYPILPMQGMTWLAQSLLADQIKDQLSNTITTYHGIIGIYGSTQYTGGSNTQPYFDVPVAVKATSGKTSTPGWAPNVSLIDGAGIAHATMRSTIQQTRAVDAVSVMSLAEGGTGLQQVTSLPNNSNYTSVDQTAVANFVAAGGRAFLAPYATLADGWTGYGYALVAQSGTTNYYMSANAALYGTYPTPTSPHQGANAAVSVSGTTLATGVLTAAMDPRANGGTGSGTGVNMATGDLMYAHTDLTVGTAFPLSIQTAYNSNATLRPSPLFGAGWMTNLEISATYADDPFHAMGHEATALDAAAAITGLYISQDLLTQDQTLTSGGTVSATGNYFIAAAYTQSWLSDQLKDNTVVLTSGGAMSLFGKLPDGTYNPPAGSAAQLTATNLTLSVKDKFGTVTQFQQLQSGFYGAGNEQVVSTVTDRVGNTTTFTYKSSSSPMLSGVSNSASRGLSFYQPNGGGVGVSDGTGRSISYTIGMTQLTDAVGNVTKFSYNTGSYNFAVKYPANPSTAAISFSTNPGASSTIQETIGGTTSTAYIAGNRAELDDALGDTTVGYADEYGRQTLGVDALGHQGTTTYDALNRVVTATATEGNYVTYAYDSRNNVIQTTSTPKPGSGLTAVTTSATYDPTWNLVTTSTDALGNTTTNSYNTANGELLSVTLPTATIQGGGNQTSITQYTSYNSRGQVLSMTGPDGMVTNYTYDPTTGEQLTQVIDSGSSPHLAITTTKTYDSMGDVATVTDPNGNKTTLTYNANRQGTNLDSATGAAATVAYTANGQQATVTSPSGVQAAFTYDVAGHLLSKTVTGTDGTSTRTTSSTYDTLGRLSTSTDALGNVTTQTYDALSRPYQTINANNQVAVTYAYTPNGLKASVTDGNGNMITESYDGFDRLSVTTYPDTTYETLTYDANGNRLTGRNRAGDITDFAYDQLNRKVTVTPPSSSGDSVKTYTYDIAGRQHTVADANGTFSYGYDTAGRMTSVERPDGKTIQYAHDQNGNRTQLTWPDGYYVNYAYDAGNRMTTAVDYSAIAMAA